MKRMGTLRSALLAVLVLASGVAAASASAAKVPGFLLLAGESGSLTFASVTNTIKTELQSAAGTLTGEGVQLKLTLTTDDEGTYTADFLSVKSKNGTSCSTSGDAAGTLLLSGKLRLVHDVSSTSGNGVLFEVPETTLTCGTEIVHVRGASLGLIKSSGTAEGGDFTHWHIDVLCKNASGGEPLEEKFWGLSGTEEKTKLEANFGAGFKKGCMLDGSEVELISNKMAELMEVG